jgi:hypothetical protein
MAPPAVSRRNVRRDVVMGSTVISVFRAADFSGVLIMFRNVGFEDGAVKTLKHSPDAVKVTNQTRASGLETFRYFLTNAADM